MGRRDNLRPMRCEPTPSTPTMRRRWCSRRCRLLATWPAVPVPANYQPRRRLLNGCDAIPIVWPPVPEPIPVPVEIERWCIDCGAPLPEREGPGRLFSRCDYCRNSDRVPDWERPYRLANGEDSFEPWLREQLRAPRLPWER
jgi:hypothetical protein